MYHLFALCFILLLGACQMVGAIDARSCLEQAEKTSYDGFPPDSLRSLRLVHYIEVPGQKIEGESRMELKFPSQMKHTSLIANINQYIIVINDSNYTQVSKLAGYKTFSDSEKQQIMFSIKRQNPKNNFVSLFDRIEFAELIVPNELCYVIDAYPCKIRFPTMKKQRYFIRKSDFMLLKEEGITYEDNASVHQVISYEDFENFSGLILPKKTIIIQENQRNEMTLKHVEINPTFSSSNFDIPQDDFKE